MVTLAALFLLIYKKKIHLKFGKIMEDKQKEDKIRNLLSSMRRKNIITTDSSNKQVSSWILVSKFKQEK